MYSFPFVFLRFEFYTHPSTSTQSLSCITRICIYAKHQVLLFRLSSRFRHTKAKEYNYTQYTSSYVTRTTKPRKPARTLMQKRVKPRKAMRILLRLLEKLSSWRYLRLSRASGFAPFRKLFQRIVNCC